MGLLSPDELDDLRAHNAVEDVARALGANLRRVAGHRVAGPCPMCGGSKLSRRFEVKTRDSWVCAACGSGGDVIRLVQLATGRDFLASVEYLGGTRPLSDAEREKLARERAARAEAEAKRAADYRERERKAAWTIWEGNQTRIFESPVGRAYLEGRGVIPPNGLRFAAELCYFEGKDACPATGRDVPRVVHRGPAMLAPIQRADGRFAGVHMTFIDPARPGEKARIVDPDSGEILPAKKSRGSTKGCVIRLAGSPRPARLFIGEGIETTLSVVAALRKAARWRADDAAWCSIDLHNLGGPHTETIAHPTERGGNGQSRRVPGPEPAEGGWPCPAGVRELVTLGDGDSEPFLTRMAHERARRRYATGGRLVRAVFAPPGMDFNDVWREPGPLQPRAKEGVAA